MKKINGTTAIVLIMALFFASCGDGDDPNGHHTTAPNESVTVPPLPMIEGGGLFPWTLNGVPLNGEETSEPIHVTPSNPNNVNNIRDLPNNLTAKVTMENGFITTITLTHAGEDFVTGTFDFDSIVPPVTFEKAGTPTTSIIAGVSVDTYNLNLTWEDWIPIVIDRMKQLNTWETVSNLNSLGNRVNNSVDLSIPQIEPTEVEEGNPQAVSAVNIAGNTMLRSIKYAVKEAVSKIAYGTIVNTSPDPDNLRDGKWTYKGKIIDGTTSVIFKGYMGSFGNGRQDYPFSDNHTVTVTLEDGVITKVYGVGSDYGCPYNGTANNGWSVPAFQLRNMEMRMLGRNSDATNDAGQPIPIEGKNDWNVDVLSTASQSKLYLRSAVYEAIKIIAREQEREQQKE